MRPSIIVLVLIIVGLALALGAVAAVRLLAGI
jgi:hypothetical protein